MHWDLEEAIAYYRTQGAPSDQTALIGLLREIQQEQGGKIPAASLTAAARAYGIKEGILLALVRRIPSLQLAQVRVLELCAGPNCGKSAALAARAEALCAGNNIELRYVPCMRQCAKGPNIRWNGTFYNRATEELLRELIR